MALWKDANGNIHDDMGGAALALSDWPQGMTELTPLEVRVLQKPAPSLAQAKAAQIDAVNVACQAELAQLLAAYPPAEVLTWSLQYNEALAYTANPSVPTPTLSAIVASASAAGGPGYTIAAQAASVLAKADAYAAASGAAVGKRQALKDMINAATTVAAVQAIVW